MFQQIMKYLNPNIAIGNWEVQVGDFMIDSIEEDDFPHQSKIKVRDYTKKLIQSQFLQTTQFKSSITTNTVEAIIRNVAINGGIDPKENLHYSDYPSRYSNPGQRDIRPRQYSLGRL